MPPADANALTTDEKVNMARVKKMSNAEKAARRQADKANGESFCEFCQLAMHKTSECSVKRKLNAARAEKLGPREYIHPKTGRIQKAKKAKNEQLQSRIEAGYGRMSMQQLIDCRKLDLDRDEYELKKKTG